MMSVSLSWLAVMLNAISVFVGGFSSVAFRVSWYELISSVWSLFMWILFCVVVRLVNCVLFFTS